MMAPETAPSAKPKKTPVGNYGYASADDPSARWNIVFLFAVIAAGGLFGHAVSVRLWPISRLCSVLIGLACGAALVINLSNSLGALAVRNSRSAAESASKASAIKEDRTELARLQEALERLGPYVATDKPALKRLSALPTRRPSPRSASAATAIQSSAAGSAGTRRMRSVWQPTLWPRLRLPRR
jgi:hypothetical protein